MLPSNGQLAPWQMGGWARVELQKVSKFAVACQQASPVQTYMAPHRLRLPTWSSVTGLLETNSKLMTGQPVDVMTDS